MPDRRDRVEDIDADMGADTIEKRVIEETRIRAQRVGIESSKRVDDEEGTSGREEEEEVSERRFFWVPLRETGYMLKFYVDH